MRMNDPFRVGLLASPIREMNVVLILTHFNYLVKLICKFVTSTLQSKKIPRFFVGIYGKKSSILVYAFLFFFLAGAV